MIKSHYDCDFNNFIKDQEGSPFIQFLHNYPGLHPISIASYFVLYQGMPFVFRTTTSMARKIADFQTQSNDDGIWMKIKRAPGISKNQSLFRRTEHEFSAPSPRNPDYSALNNEAMSIYASLLNSRNRLSLQDYNRAEGLFSTLDSAKKLGLSYPNKELWEYQAITGFNLLPPQHNSAYEAALKCFSSEPVKPTKVELAQPKLQDFADELYDAYNKHDHAAVAVLLPKYRAATGKDKPGFMI